jgi:hypothetical protein
MGIPKGIGLDLDNTVIDYTPAYRATAARMGLPPEFTGRESIRPLLRRSEVDDLEWQCFQALLYTEGLACAEPAAGLRDFLNLCAELPVRVFIVSHKTATTPTQFGGQDLRGPAKAWLVDQGIAPDHINFDDIYFCSTRAEKVRTIAALGCEAFVDDLIEVLEHPDLPIDIKRFHYQLDTPVFDSPVPGVQPANFTSLTTWLASC